MNYTGDVLNFGMGVEKARAMGKKVEMLIVDDDVGVGRAKSGKVGRRGIAGAALVVKICGALAEAGADMDEILKIGTLAKENVVSVAVSLSRVHVIGRPLEDADEELQRLPHGTVELGMGIHNEPGCEQLTTDLPGTVQKMLSQLLDPDDTDRAYVSISKGDPVVLLINNFGGLSNLELGAISWEVAMQLDRNWGLRPKRVFASVFNGSLNGLGFGVSILKLVDTNGVSGRSLLELIDAPAQAVGWPQAIGRETWEKSYKLVPKKENAVEEEKPSSSNLRSKSDNAFRSQEYRFRSSRAIRAFQAKDTWNVHHQKGRETVLSPWFALPINEVFQVYTCTKSTSVTCCASLPERLRGQYVPKIDAIQE